MSAKSNKSQLTNHDTRNSYEDNKYVTGLFQMRSVLRYCVILNTVYTSVLYKSDNLVKKIRLFLFILLKRLGNAKRNHIFLNSINVILTKLINNQDT